MNNKLKLLKKVWTLAPPSGEISCDCKRHMLSVLTSFLPSASLWEIILLWTILQFYFKQSDPHNFNVTNVIYADWRRYNIIFIYNQFFNCIAYTYMSISHLEFMSISLSFCSWNMKYVGEQSPPSTATVTLRRLGEGNFDGEYHYWLCYFFFYKWPYVETTCDYFREI